jgi:copper(I)-binding protein
MTSHLHTRATAVPALILLAVTTLFAATGCAPASEQAAPATAVTAAESISIQDAWVKAADEGMSAAFGTLENSGDTDITVVSAQSPASTMIELHETVENDAGEMVMQAKDGGFVIPANGSLELAPGGNHIMLMGLTAPVQAGDESTFTLTLDDGSTYEFTAPAKDYAGANETYEGDMDMDMVE